MFPVAVAAVFPVTAAVGVDGMDERASDLGYAFENTCLNHGQYGRL